MQDLNKSVLPHFLAAHRRRIQDHAVDYSDCWSPDYDKDTWLNTLK
jgi:hypothetical protein